MKHTAYIRVSTGKQDQGPKAQLDAILRWAEVNGVTIDSTYSEVISGGAPLERRMALMEAIDSLDEGDVLVAAKRDRIGRDVVLTAMIERLVERRGAKLVIIEGVDNGATPEAKLMRTMVDAFAEYERAVIRARTKAALAAKKARGEAISGHPPFGWAKVGPNLQENDHEQACLARIHDLRANGLSVLKIVAALKAEKWRPRGKDWHLTTIVRILKQA